jgi:hypothetical protein
MKQEIEKTTWWYDDATYQLGKSILIFACLHISIDGTAKILCEDWQKSFISEDEAEYWLTDEEFSSLTELNDEYGLTVKLPGLDNPNNL